MIEVGMLRSWEAEQKQSLCPTSQPLNFSASFIINSKSQITNKTHLERL